jgi:flagellar basal-body rod modification protein FlgD
MQNQDPTQPMDPTQTVTQLATFSGVEQAVQTNSILSSLLSNSSLSQASSLIGHTVTSADGSTTGVIQSVSLTSAGMTATLANGGTVTLTSGITIS